MKHRGLLFILLSVACFGSASIFARFAYDAGINLVTMLTVRFGISAALLFIYSTFARESLRLAPKDLKLVLLLGAVGYGIMAYLYFGSLQYIPVSMATLITYTYPTIVTVMAYFILKEPLSQHKLLCLAMASIGCALMVWAPGLKINLTGAALAFGSSVTYSIYIIYTSQHAGHLPPRTLTFYIVLGAFAVYLVIGTLTRGFIWNLPWQAWAATASLAVIPTVLGNIFFFTGLRHMGATKTALVSTVEPIYVVLMAMAIFNERITLIQGGGGLLIIAAVVLLQLRGDNAINT
jgi:drug/metabolite transporter (DMT)-like permease